MSLKMRNKQPNVAAWEHTFLQDTTHLHMYNEFPYYSMVSCNSSLKSHRSCHHRCSTKNLFLKILQNSQENTCVFNKVAVPHIFLETYYKIKKNPCKLFFLKPWAWKHANYVCFHKLIHATSNMAEGTKQYVHFSLLGRPESPHKNKKTICALMERNQAPFYMVLVLREGHP